jgi:hypothetical protein
MHTQETKHKFIELRAAGLSFRRISEELGGVDKNTLMRWNEQFAVQIHNLEQIELENLQEQLLGSKAERFKALAHDYHRYTKELERREPGRVPQYMLFRIVCRLRDQVEQRITPPQFRPEPDQQPGNPEVAP